MLTGGLAKRYARAFMDAAARGGIAGKLAGEISMARNLFSTERDLVACLASPIVSVAVKKRVIIDLLSAKASALTVNFLCLLVEKKRFELLPAISEALDELFREAEGIALVSVVSALPVNAGDNDYLKGRLERWLGKKVQLSVALDASLLCGIQIRVGDRFYDGSGLGQLAQIRAAFSN